MSFQNRLLCPVCGNDDRIEKVSTIYSSGLSMGNYTGYGYGVGSVAGNLVVTSNSMNIHGQSQTLLSEKLAPPLAPWQKYSSKSKGSGWIITGVIALSFSPCMIWFPLILSEESTNKSLDTSLSLLVIAILCLLFCAMIVFGIATNIRSARQRRSFIAAETPRWQQAMHNWDCLYYCHRNDVVFNATSPHTHAPAHHMFNLL